MKTSIDFCEEFNHWGEIGDFILTHTTMAEAWSACLRVDWLLWILEKQEINPDEKTLRGFSCWCARNTPLIDGRTTWDLLTDKRSRIGIEVAERFIRGEATEGELKIAAKDVRNVAISHSAYAADATDFAAGNAVSIPVYATFTAFAVFDTNAASVAGAAARHAVNAATYTAEADARDAAESAARKAQADYFRTLIPNPFL